MTWIGEQGDLAIVVLFLVALAVVSIAEAQWPHHGLAAPIGRRWAINLGLFIVGWLAASLALAGLARLGGALGLAPPNLWATLGVKPWGGTVALSVIAGLLALDLVGYAVHRCCHRVHFLWR